MRFFGLLITVALSAWLSPIASAQADTAVPTPALVCKADGLAPAGEGDCSKKEGLVAMTGFLSGSYETCLERAEAADKLPLHSSPWQPSGGQAWGTADEDQAKAQKARQDYCRGVHPLVTDVAGNTQGAAAVEYASKVAVALDTVDNCVTRLKAAAEIPLNDGLWKDQTPEEFCKEKVKTPEGKKYRSRWDQVGGGWTTGWVAGHDDAVCGASINCSCEANACGTFKKGETTSVWPQGCTGPKWTIRCDSEAEDGSSEEGGGKYRWAKVNTVSNAGKVERCFKGQYEGESCSRAGDTCSLMRGNALAGTLTLEFFECK